MPRRTDADPADPALGSVDPALHPPVALPDGDWDWFSARCAALKIPLDASRRPAIEALYGHLIGVNRWLNLTTQTSPRDYLKQHVLDSLSLIGDPRLRHLSQGAPCADLGSGGGYPGLPLALWHPSVRWCLIDARRKKVDFLTAAGKLAVAHGARQVTAHHLRGSEAPRDPNLQRSCQLVVSRAMGQAATVLAEAAPLLQRSGHLIIYKGPAYTGEEEQTANAACRDLGFRPLSQRWIQLEEGDPERVQVIFERIL